MTEHLILLPDFFFLFCLVSNLVAITVEFPAKSACFSDSTLVSIDVFSSHPIFDGEGGWKIEGWNRVTNCTSIEEGG